ncbi:AbrB/MazE/SpoVT family DNA-binding domain-containing protein [Desulfovibrio sp.]|uniref:AbrB/MazE/SpoVT family DNA-binding domain-containing protein n=1 Tax=Desulfovibrio sp. TaxID=885 RepID=UPI0025B9165E|nr:AbrB/MazE/SpoVT family DNA-binding domain-containing protein [Desulfovibrio sp.]
MEMAKVSSKGQINIPIAVRKHLNLTEGDKVIFIIDDDGGVRMLNASSLNVKEGGGAPVKKA